MTKEIENLAVDIMSRMPDAVLLAHGDDIKTALLHALAPQKVEEMITIPKSQYAALLERDDWLTCLENAGVDNWDGWEIAAEEYRDLNNSVDN